MTTELEERFQELVSMKNVMGVIVLNEEGAAIKSSLDPKDTEAYAKMVTNIVTVSKKEFKEVDPSNDITFMRFRFAFWLLELFFDGLFQVPFSDSEGMN